MGCWQRLLGVWLMAMGTLVSTQAAQAELKTWDGKHSIDQIEVTVVYFLPKGRTPLPDWKDRASYFCRRIERFHEREFHGQSVMKTDLQPEPFVSARTVEQLRDGDGDFIFFQTVREVDGVLQLAKKERKAFPILLVLSDINWRPLDDFFRVKPASEGKFVFEGNYSNGRHFPGAAAGGARATYLADRGMGMGLVSADGWRVPCSGGDCVVYHEGVGHTIGLPHPQPGNGSVMSLGQYNGWISESWLDDAQKKRLGWTPPEKPVDRKADLFSAFKALPDPLVPKPNEPVRLKLTWPEGVTIKSLRVRFQTEQWGPWIEPAVVDVPILDKLPNSDRLFKMKAPESVLLGQFDRATPVSYRVDAVLEDGRDVELWGYFQVREKPDVIPLPHSPDFGSVEKQSRELPTGKRAAPHEAIDLLALVDVTKDRVSGEWTSEDGKLVSPKALGSRIELPYQPPDEYELVVITEPLDEPNGLILGQRSGDQRFQVLINYAQKEGAAVSAIENIDGKNVGANVTTIQRPLLTQNRLSQIICTVKKDSVTVMCDGQVLIDWHGDAKRLSLSDYWKTPHDNALFLGAYDCRYRFHRVTLTPLNGEGKRLRAE